MLKEDRWDQLPVRVRLDRYNESYRCMSGDKVCAHDVGHKDEDMRTQRTVSDSLNKVCTVD